MPEWLVPVETTEGSMTSAVLASRLVLSFVFGVVVAGIYRMSHGREQANTDTLAATLILLSILIAMVSMTIGNSVARAFSLVGALSIVRFRTVVDDTRDTAFVIFAVIVGMAAGCGLLMVPLIGIPVVGFASIGMSHWRRAARITGSVPCRLSIRLALGRDPETTLGEILRAHFDGIKLMDVSTARQGAALDLKYVGNLRAHSSMAPLVHELNRIEGVMNVELFRADP